ncbi:JAB domain-containing protein [Erythrobacter sp.]|uniref:JAB domain-containing protein n=1 Tax=Erythrobacter sp. TaxID=1042 RepID=UPI001B28AE8F|nr:JAB domain-containing protein [Erythrobacter sp.]MBO6525679.1 hypothetical protein [Erythrobacter sp.]MBO6529647.1 hypothetical protein [Erythrobacter sp.]
MLAPLSADPWDLAERLLERFGSIGALIDASEAELRQCAHPGERWVDVFLAIRQLLRDGIREQVLRTPLGKDRKGMERYLLETMGCLRRERMIAIMADRSGFIISEEIVAEGGEGEIQVSPRALFGRALSLDARRMLIAHNHPSGSAEPSASDISQTRDLVSQAERLGVLVDDHLVVGRREVVSMRERGLM